ncbi:MAG: beta-galactosidase, partial [Verrucomicrobiales bacterium]|nr:beta-galactosidase [Verrucomicrobiales bacterium]
MTFLKLIAACLTLTMTALTVSAESLPKLERGAHGTLRLTVNDRPFLVLGGELHNSAASNDKNTAKIFPRLKAMGLNTVIAPVYWELTEPEEGKFDFQLLDAMVRQAREQNLKLIVLWFGSYKNGKSTYPPPWVMGDPQRFPRQQWADGGLAPYLSVTAPVNWQTDARAFAAMMKHLREIDDHQRTVIAVQVENEVGIFGNDVKKMPAITAAANDTRVPDELADYLTKHSAELLPETRAFWSGKVGGSWREMFGAAAEEIYLAWHLARYQEHVTVAGKAEYPLPMFVNTWIKQHEEETGYPWGGPNAAMFDIWRAGAPSIELFSLDIYDPDFKLNAALFTRQGNPLFLPEIVNKPVAVPMMLYAVGHSHATCVSPFGIEDAPVERYEPLYRRLAAIAPRLLAAMGTDQLQGVWFDRPEAQSSEPVFIAGRRLTVTRTGQPDAAVLLLEWDASHVLALGQGVGIDTDRHRLAGVIGEVENGEWKPGGKANENGQPVKLEQLG